MTKGVGQLKKSLFASIYKPPIDDGRPRSMVIKAKPLFSYLTSDISNKSVSDLSLLALLG